MKHDHDRVEALLHRALELKPEERAAFLSGACGDDHTLRAQVETLLAADDQAQGFLEHTANLMDTPISEGPGTKIGRYKLLQQVGEGGMGVVYMAEQEEPVRRRVALKVIKLGMDTKSVIARFEAERQALAMMDHPNIAKVLDAGATDSGRPFFVMELVKGIPITRFCDESKLTIRQRLDLFISVCQAIQHAHQKGIIHRDIKPSNILVTLHDGVPVPKVIDFGIAKATEGRLTDRTLFTAFEQFLGTPAYMSPEQAEMSGLDIDTRSDIYALGVLLYQLLTGKTPFDGKELMAAGVDAMRKTIREVEPPRPSTRLSTMQGEALTATAQAHGTDAFKLAGLVRGDLDWIVMKCLEKDRTRRYETANGVVADLQRHLHNEPLAARPPSTAYRLQKAIRRNKVACAAGSIVALALLFGLGFATFAFLRERASFRAMVAAEQRSAAERVRFAILSGDDNRTTQALKEAEEKGLSVAKLRFLRGLHLMTSAQARLAIPELDAVRELEPDNVAALGLLATARMTVSGWQGYEQLIPELEKARPITPEDSLFLGQALSLANPQAGIPLMEQAVRSEDSPMARIILAGARTQAAAKTGDLATIRLALADIAAAEAWARHSLPVLLASAHAHRVAAGIHSRAGDLDRAKAEAEAASRASERLEAFHPNLQALHARLAHLILSGSADQALERARRWSREIPGANLDFYAVWVLMMQGDLQTALELTRRMTGNSLMRTARFLAAMDSPGSRAEAELVLQDFSTRPPNYPDELFAAVAVNLLSGRTEKAREIAREYVTRMPPALQAKLSEHVPPVIKFLAGELSEEALLQAADGPVSLCLSHNFIGLGYLATGNRALARRHFQISRETGADQNPAYSISMYFLKRLEASPNWPPTIPPAKGQLQ
jgi:serine/threonine protein kinase